MLNILNVAQTGLAASQTQVENVMNNLANENTEGYKRRVIDISEIEHADSRMTGRGVEIEGISRTTNIYMYQNIIEEQSKLSSLTELNSMLGDIESIFFETDDAGFSADFNRYFQSIENLKTSPQNEIYKNDLKTNGNIIVEDLKNLYSSIEIRESETLKKDVSDTVNEINNILNTIGDLSKEIQDSFGSNEPLDLLDKRDVLEKELSTYIDVEISREDTYELKIGGMTAVRFDTNIHAVSLIENYTPQSDVYAKLNPDGTTFVDPITGDYSSSLINSATWGTPGTSEVQSLQITGDATDQVYFLGTAVTGADGTVGHKTPSEIATDIVADSAAIISNWNSSNPEQEILSITDLGSGELQITYVDTEGDMAYLPHHHSSGIDFIQSKEVTKGHTDSLTYILNNDISIKITNGETVTDHNGVAVDLNGDGDNTNDTVNSTNIISALVYKMNHSIDTDGKVIAYNGQYELADDGSKILTNDPRHSKYDAIDPEKDRYLVIESAVDGEVGKFTGEIVINDGDATTIDRHHIEKNDYLSKGAIDDIHLEIFDKELNLKSGTLKSMIDNIKTDSGNNDFAVYKQKLDQFANALSNYSQSYIQNEDQSYIYGMDTIEVHDDYDKKVDINLFVGADVSSLKFDETMVNTLTQEKLDYLATIQWKTDIDFVGDGADETSFSQFYQSLRVHVADDRENVIFKEESQAAVSESMNTAYDKLTKVDKDNEMVELIKFQAAYEANAKVITTLNDMLAVLLGMVR